MANEADDIVNRTVALSGTWFRLIPSRFPTINLYERVATGDERDVLTRFEMLTNPRAREKDIVSRGTPIDVETSPKFQNWNHAPFAYPSPEGTRYLSALYGALELSSRANQHSP